MLRRTQFRSSIEPCPSKGFSLYRQDSDPIQTRLPDEDRLLELISTDAPLARVLDKLCTALDLQLGNVVSLVLLSDVEEHSTHTIAQSAAQFGLSVFCCTAILSQSGELLGTFEVYCCFPQTPTPSESKLIERATQLASLAIQRHNHEQDSGCFPFQWRSAMGSDSREEPPSRN
jgi:hypothetical protein